MGTVAVEGGGGAVEVDGGVGLLVFGVAELGEELIHPFKTGLLGFREMELEVVGIVGFGKIEEEAAGRVGKEGERFDGDGVGAAVVDVFLEHEVLEKHGAFVFAVHPLAQQRVFLESIDVFEEALAHGVEGVGEVGDLFGTCDGGRFAVLACGDGKG